MHPTSRRWEGSSLLDPELDELKMDDQEVDQGREKRDTKFERD